MLYVIGKSKAKKNKKVKPLSTIQLAWFGSADVMESVDVIRQMVTNEKGDTTFQRDLGSTTLTLCDGKPIHFYNNHFVAVVPKNSKLFYNQ